MSHRAGGLLLVACAGLLASAAAARPKTGLTGAAPAWLCEAATRDVTGASGDVAWLHDELVIEPQSGGGVKWSHRLAGKVLTESGLDTLGTWSFARQKGDQVIEFHAWNLRPDGDVRVPDPKDD